ncbi:CDP-glycerol glycerophosphotransferase [Ruminococcaceae bacterium R-25]|nr:CDP-glycerol glycerophosphotransferase [Ruminococcaceae bacterium R-25]SUQ11267.1 CDP-glycerol glycerophosphotransferase [Oscillospiraceae bacterium]
MRKRLIYILKHNVILQKLYRVIMSFVFRVMGLFVKTDDKLILFVSFMGLGFNDSPKAIYDYLKSHPEYGSYRMVWAFEKPQDHKELDTVRIDSFKYFKTALKAKYWVTNTNIERGLKFKKKSQIYLNTWHGIALKHIGNDCPGRKDYNFNTVDHLVVSGDHDEKVWKSAFNADEKTYLRCGMPRNEELWLASEERRAELKSKLGLPSDKKIILYAPTWRDSTDGGANYEIKPPIHLDIWKKTLGSDYIVLFRAHHQTTKVLGIQFDEFVRDYSEYPAVNDLIIVSDILITDYSAIAFDYSVLCKPIFCYAYDYETYLADRGTYFDIDDYYPNKSCRTEDDLLDRICNCDYEMECSNTKTFRDRFIKYGIGATKACVDACFGSKCRQ